VLKVENNWNFLYKFLCCSSIHVSRAPTYMLFQSLKNAMLNCKRALICRENGTQWYHNVIRKHKNKFYVLNELDFGRILVLTNESYMFVNVHVFMHEIGARCAASLSRIGNPVDRNAWLVADYSFASGLLPNPAQTHGRVERKFST